MREIRFRGRDKRYDGTWEPWMYGSLDLSDLWPAIIENGPPLSVQPETIGQFTGLKDANGTEIYEGDVVEFKHCNNLYEGIVKYCERTAAFNLWFNKIKIPIGGDITRSLVVIGNVFDNPEFKERFWKVWEENQK